MRINRKKIHLSEFNTIYTAQEKKIKTIKHIPKDIIVSHMFEYLTFPEKIVFSNTCKEYQLLEEKFCNKIYSFYYFYPVPTPHEFTYEVVKSPEIIDCTSSIYCQLQLKYKSEMRNEPEYYNSMMKWGYIFCHCSFKLLEIKKALFGGDISITKLLRDGRINKSQENVLRKVEWYFKSKKQDLSDWLSRDLQFINDNLFYCIFYRKLELPHPHDDPCMNRKNIKSNHDLHMIQQFLSFESSPYV